jgi:hypothetical protein
MRVLSSYYFFSIYSIMSSTFLSNVKVDYKFFFFSKSSFLFSANLREYSREIILSFYLIRLYELYFLCFSSAAFVLLKVYLISFTPSSISSISLISSSPKEGSESVPKHSNISLSFLFSISFRFWSTLILLSSWLFYYFSFILFCNSF